MISSTTSTTWSIDALAFSLRLLCIGLALNTAVGRRRRAELEYPNVTLTKLTFGSCHKRKYEFPQIWQRIQEQESQVWLWLGDAVYPPMRGIAPVPVLEQEYNALKQNQGYAKLIETTPFVFGTWDDHDFGGNDMGKDMPQKYQRRDAFWDFIGHSPSNEQRKRQGVQQSVTFGQAPYQVKLILLDTRTYRDDHCGIPSLATHFPLGAGVACATRWIAAGLASYFCKQRNATMLGEEQWQWLEEELSTSTAALNIIASSVQVLSTNPVMEGWCHFPSERTRLLRLLQKTPGALLLSGDVHYAEILDKAFVTEVTSSGMTHVCTKHIYGIICKPLLDTFRAHRSDPQGYYIGRNFGSLTINWDDKSVEVQIHDAVSGGAVLKTGHLPILGQTPSSLSDEHLEKIPTCMDGHLIPVAVAAASGVLLLFIVWRRR